MRISSKLVRRWGIIGLVAASVPLTACAGLVEQQEAQPPIELSLKISPKGQVMLLDENEEAVKLVPLSERPIPATEVQSIETINIIRVYENPCYVYICLGGRCAWVKVSDDNCSR